MYKVDPKTRFQVVSHYLNKNTSLKETAIRYGVHYQSVFKWVRWYRKHGMARLFDTYKRPWNRKEKRLEEKIVSLKEGDPCLTVRRAQEILKEEGIKLSLKCIWEIWKRYGLAGYVKRDLSNDFVEQLSWSREATLRFRQAEELYNLGLVEESAKILNSITALPKNSLIRDLPESLCNFRRRIERKLEQYGEVPLSRYLASLKKLYQTCIDRKLYYSALNIGLTLLAALSWAGRPEELLVRVREMERLIRKQDYSSNTLFFVRFNLLISEAIANAKLLNLKRARGLARICNQMLKRRRPIPYGLMTHLATLYFHLQEFRKAEKLYEILLPYLPEEERKATIVRLAEIYYVQGSYNEAIRTLKTGRWYRWSDQMNRLFYRSMRSLMAGDPRRAIEFATRALLLSRKDAIPVGLLKAYMAISSSYCALGEKVQAKRTMKRLLLYARRSKRAEAWLEILLGKKRVKEKPAIQLPATRLAILLKAGRYHQALDQARKKAMSAYLHRFIFFIPEVVQKEIEKGRPTGLPRSVLRLPIFNPSSPTYNIRFLGKVVVYKNQRYLKIRLRPEERAFLIQLARRAGTPGRKIMTRDLCQNFWPKTKRPSRNLSQMLVRIKKLLRIPTHLL